MSLREGRRAVEGTQTRHAAVQHHYRKAHALDPVEQQFCTYLQDEGIGTLYERIVKGRMLRQLAREAGYASVLEFGCAVTKGYDNLVFLDQGLTVTLADADIGRIEAGWRFAERPRFCTLEDAPVADLVWAFASVQLDPYVIDRMKSLARKHLLVFVPNVLNPGAPIHFAYHLLSRTECKHAERGEPARRTRPGLVRLLASHGVHVLSSGYIDAPPIPNIAISIRELKQAIRGGRPDQAGGASAAPRAPATMWKSMQTLTHFEASPIVRPLKPVVAHHIFALGALE